MPTARDLPDPLEFSVRLNQVLAARGYTDHGASKRLGKEYGVKAPTVSGWRSGRFLPSFGKVKRMAKAWDVPADWLYWNEGPAPDLTPRTPARARSTNHARADDTEAIKFAMGALASVMTSVRSSEAVELAAAMRSQLRRPEYSALANNHFLSELLAIFDEGQAAQKSRA